MDKDSNSTSIRDFLEFQITIDPCSLLIGGLGAMIIGLMGEYVADPVHTLDPLDFDAHLNLMNTTFKTLSSNMKTAMLFFANMPTTFRCGTRFIAGGTLYHTVDAIILKILGYRASYASGVVTAIPFTLETKPLFMIGSFVAMAGFACAANYLCQTPVEKLIPRWFKDDKMK